MLVPPAALCVHLCICASVHRASLRLQCVQSANEQTAWHLAIGGGRLEAHRARLDLLHRHFLSWRFFRCFQPLGLGGRTAPRHVFTAARGVVSSALSPICRLVGQSLRPATSMRTAKATFSGNRGNGDVAVWFMNRGTVASAASVANVSTPGPFKELMPTEQRLPPGRPHRAPVLDATTRTGCSIPSAPPRRARKVALAFAARPRS